MNLKGARPSPAVPIMACNILLCAFQDEQDWPESFIKVRYYYQLDMSGACIFYFCRGNKTVTLKEECTPSPLPHHTALPTRPPPPPLPHLPTPPPYPTASPHRPSLPHRPSPPPLPTTPTHHPSPPPLPTAPSRCAAQ